MDWRFLMKVAQPHTPLSSEAVLSSADRRMAAEGAQSAPRERFNSTNRDRQLESRWFLIHNLHAIMHMLRTPRSTRMHHAQLVNFIKAAACANIHQLTEPLCDEQHTPVVAQIHWCNPHDARAFHPQLSGRGVECNA